MNNQWSSQNNFAHNKALLTNRAAGATHGRTAKPRSVRGKVGKPKPQKDLFLKKYNTLPTHKTALSQTARATTRSQVCKRAVFFAHAHPDRSTEFI